jgi:cation diffusion facilitator CzcD-associated flavoprotein CzcO
MTTHDVIVLGAGPYGLAAGNHLKQIKGLDVRVFGDPMSFWARTMPKGMFLRSNWTATQIADPTNMLSLESFQSQNGNHLSTPVPLDRFVQYGLWYQRRALPDVDRRMISRVDSDPKGFRVTLDDGETLTAKRVVVAAGIGSFVRRPAEYSNLPSNLASHTSEHADLAVFAGKSVLVIGGGQSALESAALLHENGANTEVIARTGKINWLQGWASKTLHHGLGKATNRLLYAPTDVGPAGISQLMARPDLLKMLPRSLQNKLRIRSVRPAGARWLVDRLKGVPIRLNTAVSSFNVSGDKITVRLSDGSSRTVDHILMGTGYRVDVSKYAFLSPGIVSSLKTLNGFPLLQEGMETSVPGLHILGAPGIWTFGPLLQFVSGTHYASKSLTRVVVRNHSPR